MTEDNTHNKESLDFVLLEIFQKILGIVIGTSDAKNPWDVDLKKFDKEKAILLFCWPLIIAKRYLYPYLELSLYKEQCGINQALSNDFSFDYILDSLSNFDIDKSAIEIAEKFENLIQENIEHYDNFYSVTDLILKLNENYEEKVDLKSIKEILKNEPKEKWIDLVFGGKPNLKNEDAITPSKIEKRIFFTSIVDRMIDARITGSKIINGILYYYLVLILFLNNFESLSNKNDYKYSGLDHNSNFALIDFDSILWAMIEYSEIYNDKIDVIIRNSLHLMVAFGSIKFAGAIEFFADGYKEIFLKNGLPKNTDYEEYKFYKNNPKYTAYITRLTDESGEDFDKFEIGVEREIEILDEYDYALEFCFEKDLSSNQFEDFITFKCDENTDQLKQLLHCLSLIAYRLSVHIHDYSQKNNCFISNTEILIDQDLEKFLESIDLIQNSYFLFNEYLDHKDFAKAIENLDMELAYECIEETRSALKKKKKTHLHPELIQDLLDANNEINFLFSTAQRKHDAHKSSIAKEFFKKNPHFFKILKSDDIKDIEFSSDPNGIRNARRKIFYSIAQKAGKEIKGYKIAKELVV